MLNRPRILIDAVRRYCAEHRIALDVRAEGWLLVLHRAGRRNLIFGYDLGLNSAVAHRLASDKAATADLLSLSGLPAVPHAFFIAPAFDGDAETPWPSMLDLLEAHPAGLVVKPNEGTSGRFVTHVLRRDQLMDAVNSLFAANTNVAISPFLDIEDEVRVVQLDGSPLLVYRKERPSVVGDGERTLLELALATVAPSKGKGMLARLRDDFSATELAAIVPAGEPRLLNWRHNLEAGARPLLLDNDPAREACVALAAQAAQVIGIRFASIDLVRTKGRWQVLEINSGVMMEALGGRYPDAVYAAYRAALDKVFAS
jgi:glutathione synthase/RimK-type ligase-like ATP-grasp enzyme